MNNIMLSECEEMVMKCAWDSEGAPSVKQLVHDVNVRYGKEWKLQTVATFVSRLVKKGYLKMHRAGRNVSYEILVKEESYKKKILGDCVNFWYAGNAADLIRDLRPLVELSEEQKAAIKDIVDAN